MAMTKYWTTYYTICFRVHSDYSSLNSFSINSKTIDSASTLKFLKTIVAKAENGWILMNFGRLHLPRTIILNSVETLCDFINQSLLKWDFKNKIICCVSERETKVHDLSMHDRNEYGISTKSTYSKDNLSWRHWVIQPLLNCFFFSWNLWCNNETVNMKKAISIKWKIWPQNRYRISHYLQVRSWNCVILSVNMLFLPALIKISLNCVTDFSLSCK